MKRLGPLVTAITLLMTACQRPNPRVATALNLPAALSGDIPVDPRSWGVITSGLNPPDATMSTLFGNERALAYARTKGDRNYPPGAMLSLVTWRQQEDARWFGANIPSRPASVEFVAVVLASDGRTAYRYQDYVGFPLRERSLPLSQVEERIAWLLSRRAAAMPY